MQLLAQGWGAQKVKDRYLRHARAAVAAGVRFEPMDHPDRSPVQALLAAQVHGLGPGWRIGRDDGGLVARDASGNLVGALLASAATFQRPYPGYLVGTVRAVAVDPSWRGRGVGVVLVGMAAKAYEPLAPDFYMGSCAPADARFYQKLGYTVLKPGEPYQFPFGNYSYFQVDNPDYPCFFYRER